MTTVPTTFNFTAIFDAFEHVVNAQIEALLSLQQRTAIMVDNDLTEDPTLNLCCVLQCLQQINANFADVVIVLQDESHETMHIASNITHYVNLGGQRMLSINATDTQVDYVEELDLHEFLGHYESFIQNNGNSLTVKQLHEILVGIVFNNDPVINATHICINNSLHCTLLNTCKFITMLNNDKRGEITLVLQYSTATA
jgi:hypothetical protein